MLLPPESGPETGAVELPGTAGTEGGPCHRGCAGILRARSVKPLDASVDLSAPGLDYSRIQRREPHKFRRPAAPGSAGPSPRVNPIGRGRSRSRIASVRIESDTRTARPAWFGTIPPACPAAASGR